MSALSVSLSQQPPAPAPDPGAQRSARVPHLSTVRADDERPRESGPRVLIADDHEDSRDALSTLLDAYGYTVVQAANGAEAVERARAAVPDLILMDMMMPHVDGFAATRALRADERFREVPIIAITAMEGARREVLEAGCDDVVVKPLDIRAFLQKVRTWVGPGYPDR
ncbi:MAG TPA: response regulator [Longimicrobium sp.]|nr:response regulator [Longimicrobium sp.]